MLSRHNIQHVFTNRQSINKCEYAEHAIKIIKQRLGMAMEDNAQNVPAKIQAIVDSFNDSISQSLSVAPSDLILLPDQRFRVGAPTQTLHQLWAMVSERRQHQRLVKESEQIVGQQQRSPLYTVGQKVRIDLSTTAKFAKVSDRRWSAETYTIEQVIPALPLPSYILSAELPDGRKTQLPGRFSQPNIIAATSS